MLYKTKNNPPLQSFIALILLTIPNWTQDSMESSAHYILGVTVAIIMFGSHVEARLPKPILKFFDFAGDVSYPLYMTHYPILFVLYLRFGSVFANREWLYYPTCVVFAIAATVLVDLPMRKYFKSRQSHYVGNVKPLTTVPAGVVTDNAPLL